MRFLTIFRASVGLALANLRYDRARTLLAILGIALAVLSTTLLASASLGTLDAGEQKYSATGRDLWITDGAEFAPGTVGGLTSEIQNSHQIAADLKSQQNVQTAVPMSIKTVYVGNGSDSDALQTVVGVGVPGDGLRVRMSDGQYFDGPDTHYANGTYNGSSTNEVIISDRLAHTLNISVGDTLEIGGTVASAHRSNYTVIGTTPAFSGFLGAPSVTLRLSELQETTGTTALDSSTFITVTLINDRRIERTEAQLEERYPEYQIRTNREQLQASIQQHAHVIASGGVLMCLAIGSGIALSLNTLLLFVHQQQRTIAAAFAQGISSTLVLMTAMQGIVLGICGGLVGLAATPFLIRLLNHVVSQYFGISAVLQLEPEILVISLLISLSISLLSAVAAGYQLTSLSPLAHLQ